MIDCRNLGTDVTARDMSVGDQFLADPASDMCGNCKTNSVVASALSGDCRIDADHFASQIQQRPAAVARIDGGIRLQEIGALSNPAAAALCTDDAGCDRRLQPERAPDGQHPVAHLNRLTVAHAKRRQIRGINPHDGQIRARIGLHSRTDKLTPIIQPDFDFIRACDNVTVGQNDPARVNDESDPIPRW